MNRTLDFVFVSLTLFSKTKNFNLCLLVTLDNAIQLQVFDEKSSYLGYVGAKNSWFKIQIFVLYYSLRYITFAIIMEPRENRGFLKFKYSDFLKFDILILLDIEVLILYSIENILYILINCKLTIHIHNRIYV